MSPSIIARLRFMLSPGKHRRRRKRPEPTLITPDQFSLMFSGQGADRKYYPHRYGVQREYRYI